MPAPIIVMAHGVGGVKEQRLDAFAERFVEAGYACLMFDYRYFGASGGRPPPASRCPEPASRLEGSDRARPQPAATVDPDRVAFWGSSFGGGHSIVTAAQDKRIVAATA